MNWEQLRAILWLRWRLTSNQLARGSKFGAVIAAIAVGAGLVLAVGGVIAATLVGALALNTAPPYGMMFVWDGIVVAVIFFSFLGVLTELQRSESIDLSRLLHLPISLKQVFVFNYLVSLVSFGTVVGLAVMLGLAAGLTISHGLQFVLAIPLALTFVFMLTAWIYCLRGWLLSLMVNPRRRRAIIMWLTLGFILVSQTPNLINLAVQRKSREAREARRAAQQSAPREQSNQTANESSRPVEPVNNKAEQQQHTIAMAEQINAWVPLLWLPNGVRGLAAGEILPSLWGGLGMFILGWMGISRAYRTTLRFYRAEEHAKPAVAKAVPLKPAKAAGNWVERRLPWMPEDVAALALAQIRSMTRAPEVRMMLAMGLFFAIFMPAMIFWRGGSATPFPEFARPFIATGVVVMVLFVLLQLVCNQFGCDRDGFRGLVLLPTPRHRLLLGKNLAVLPLAAGIAIVPLVAVSILTKLSVIVVLATALQFAAAFLLFCLVGNFSSILVPYRIAAGSLKPTKQSWQAALLMLVVHMLFPLAIAPVFVAPLLGFLVERIGWLPAAPVNLLVTLVLVGVFAALYWFTLRPLGRFLQRRETKILRLVTEAME